MLPRKIFEILHAAMAILVLFEHFSGKFRLNFLILILSSPTSLMMHFVHTFSICVLKAYKAYCYRRSSKSGKICIYQKHI